MARLTRTQKYAELRSQLENAREQQLQSEDLNKYEEKLDQLNIDKDIYAKEEVKNNETITLSDLSSILDDSLNTEVSKLNIIDETPEEIKDEEILDDVQEEVKEVNDETKSEQANDTSDDFMPFDFLQEEDIISSENKEDISDAPIIGTEYLDSTINEVNAYNKDKGLITASEMPEAVINEIRQNSKLVEEETIEDEDDLSNTVTMEIKKILNALDEEVDATETPVIEEESTNTQEPNPKLVETEELSEDVAALLKTYINSEDTSLEQTIVANNEPVHSLDEELLKTKEENKQEDNHLLNETKAFEFTTTQAVNNVVKEEENQPNKVLNVILIILIIVLLVILGFIGYLILVAQGII